MELKEQFEKVFIPSLEQMIIKEKEHLYFLRKHILRKTRPKMINIFIYNSEEALRHYELRLNQYVSYSENL